MLSRTKPAAGPGAADSVKEKQKQKKVLKWEDFLSARDYTGAVTLLEVGARFYAIITYLNEQNCYKVTRCIL